MQKTTFLTPKIDKTRVLKRQKKVSIFGPIFELRALILPCWYLKKKRRRAWTPGRFCEVASHGKAFSFFSVFLKKISINCRFFTQKEHQPAQKKETFCMKKITSYLLRFCKTNSQPLLKKNTYLLQKKEVLIEK